MFFYDIVHAMNILGFILFPNILIYVLILIYMKYSQIACFTPCSIIDYCFVYIFLSFISCLIYMKVYVFTNVL